MTTYNIKFKIILTTKNHEVIEYHIVADGKKSALRKAMELYSVYGDINNINKAKTYTTFER